MFSIPWRDWIIYENGTGARRSRSVVSMVDDHGDASVVDRNLLLLCWCVILLLNNYYNTCKGDCTCTRQKNACDCEWLTALSAT